MTRIVEQDAALWPSVDASIIQLPQIPARRMIVTDYGAVGDGVSDNTEAFERAIRACAETGGGKVIIPAGVWLTGPIRLRSRIELHAEAGALVRFSTDFDKYPLIATSYEGRRTVRCRSGLDGEELHDIAITGRGIFDGGGEAWRPVKRSKLTAEQWGQLVASGGTTDEAGGTWWPSESARDGRGRAEQLDRLKPPDPEAYRDVRDYLRPVLVSLRRCRRVLLEEATFQNSPAWCVHPWASEHVTVRRISVRNPWYSQNGDGLDLDSCRYALVEDCTFDVGDDAICMKSGKDEDGRALGIPCEQITIRGCTVYHGHGGFVIGSEMSGGVRDVKVSDCTFIGTDIGLRFKSARGRGGIVERIQIDRVRMLNIKGEAISFHLFYAGQAGSGYAEKTPEPITDGTPVFRNIRLSDVQCAGAETALMVNGLPELPLRHLVLDGFRYAGQTGIRCVNAGSLIIRNASVAVAAGPVVELDDCQNVELERLSGDGADDDCLLRVLGGQSANIVGRELRHGPRLHGLDAVGETARSVRIELV